MHAVAVCAECLAAILAKRADHRHDIANQFTKVDLSATQSPIRLKSSRRVVIPLQRYASS